MNWFDTRLYGSTLLEWSIAVLVTICITFILRYAHRVAVERLRDLAQTTVTRLDNFAVEVFTDTRLPFMFIVAAYIGAQYLHLPPKAARAVDNIAIVTLLIQVALWGQRAIAFWVGHVLQAKRGTDGAGMVTMSALGFMVRLVLWSVISLMILDNIGINVTALVTSLGIGGIAVALAVQNILSDIFASLSITLDKPFVIGDFIISGETMGVVEHIGLKTTRLRSLSGEQIVLPNGDLLKSRIHNHKRMIERRVQFRIGIAPDTPTDTLERIPAMVREIIEAQPKARFERAHFKEYGENALHFEVVYFVKDPEYHLYMDIQQAINLSLLRRFGEEQVGLAYPKRAPAVSTTAAPAPRAATH